MSRFIVHTDVEARELGPLGFMKSVPEMLYKEHLNDVKFHQAYVCALKICHCVNDRKMMCEFEGPDMDTVRNALTKIGMPITAILAKPN
jgi:hypothetical protein